MTRSAEQEQEQEPDDVSHIQQFYRGQCVLVTGSTGFVGKVLVEKLLRCCPGITTVYLLIRTKKGRSPQQRIQQLFTEKVFSRLMSERPEALDKVVAVSGDSGRPDLALSPEDRKTLCQNVTVVFHGAATVRFDEELKLATAINVRGTQEVLRLAKEMPNLKALVHVSTAYSQCNEPRLEERVYEAPVSPLELLATLAPPDADDADVKDVTKVERDPEDTKLPAGYPNTYTLTKAVAEQIVRDEGVGLPVAIVRPSMVVATSQEPVGGWIDNVYGPTGICVAATVGLLKVTHCDKRATANIVPCDLVVNCILAAAWDVATNRSAEPRVYNLVSSDAPLPWATFMAYYKRFAVAVPPMNAVWAYSMCLTTSKALFWFYKYVVHMVPAVLVDAALALTTGKPRMVSAYRKIHRFLDMTGYFSVREWQFDNSRTKELWSRLGSRDRALFPFDMRDFDWDLYFYRYVRGVRLYILKEDLANVEEATRRWHRLVHADLCLRAVVVALLLWLLWSVLTIVFEL